MPYARDSTQEGRFLQLGERRQRLRRILNLPVILLLEGSLPKAGGGSMTPVKVPRSGLQLVRLSNEGLRGCESDAAARASNKRSLVQYSNHCHLDGHAGVYPLSTEPDAGFCRSLRACAT
jgi:hypothetical protein